jgi:hypothetical protein
MPYIHLAQSGFSNAINNSYHRQTSHSYWGQLWFVLRPLITTFKQCIFKMIKRYTTTHIVL